MKIISREFYNRNTEIVAQDLLGKLLIRKSNGVLLISMIVETEAYGNKNDSASHAYRNKTNRNAAMFGLPGCAYVYFIYGNHFCFNIVAKDTFSCSGAVLIRAVQPVKGIKQMMHNRKKSGDYILTNGPGKLTQALTITNQHNFIDVTQKNNLYIVNNDKIDQTNIVCSPRIGITKAQDKLWRFYIKNNCWVSK